MELNINSLLSETNVINIRDENNNTIRKITFPKMSISKALNIAEKYNDLMNDLVKKYTSYLKNKEEINKFKELSTDKQIEYILNNELNYTKEFYKKVIKLCVDIIKPEKLFDKIKYIFSKNKINTKYINYNFGAEEVNEFVQLVLKPIMSEKKTKLMEKN